MNYFGNSNSALGRGTLLKIRSPVMDPSDYPASLDSAEYLSASDPVFGLLVAILILGVFVFWVWQESSGG